MMLMAQYRKSRAACEEAVAMARRVGVRAEEGHALNSLALDLAYLGQVDEGITGLLEARKIAEEVGDFDDIGRAYLNLAELLLGAADRPRDAVDIAREGLETTRRLGLARDYGVSLQAIAATAMFALGHWRAAEQMLREAEELQPSEVARTDLLHARVQLAAARQRRVGVENLRGLGVDLGAYLLEPRKPAPIWISRRPERIEANDVSHASVSIIGPPLHI